MNTDVFVQILEDVREHYLDALQKSLSDLKQKHSSVAAELLLEIGRETAYAFRLYRVDMATTVDGVPKMCECNLSNYLNFSPRTFTLYPGLSLALSPIAWNGVEIMIDMVPPLAALEQWTLRWLDVNDTHEDDERGYQSVIHSVTAPTTADGWTTFSVDFGSAPVVAVQELLQLLAEIGTTTVVMKSDWMHESAANEHVAS